MRKDRRVVWYFVLVGVCLLNACDDKDQVVDKEETVRKVLTSGQWRLESVILDGVPEPDYLDGLRITFSSSSITVQNGAPIFPPQDTWTFTSDDATGVETGSGLTIDLVQVTDLILVIRFQWSDTTLGGGRNKSIAGQHEVRFGR